MLAEHDRRYDYTVAWSDSMAGGRAWDDRSSPAATSPTSPTCRRPTGRTRSRSDPGTRARCSGRIPPGLINRYTVRLANEAWYRKAPRCADRGAADHRGVLPSAGRDQELEQGLRPGRLPAVPVRACRSAQEAAVRRSFELVSARARAVVRDRPQAVRRKRPRAALLPHGRLDARARLPRADARPRPGCSGSSTSSSSKPAAASTWPRTHACRPRCSAGDVSAAA